ncbi:hypothetical protein XF35_01650 [Streptomyces platensis subsp. clarensis]|nr:hypothetical protein [Streptomyces platensis subsp. clarensis]
MNEERREQYAAALEECLIEGYDEPRKFADAAMAVADEEIRQLHIGIEGGHQSSVKALADENGRLRSAHQKLIESFDAMESRRNEADEENARLRAELERSKAAHRAVWAKHQERGTRIFELLGENGRLRDELADVRKDAEYFKGWADGNGHRLTEAQATIERVRAVSEQYPKAPWLHGPSIRAALDGTS